MKSRRVRYGCALATLVAALCGVRGTAPAWGAAEPWVLMTDSAVLSALEKNGGSLAERLGSKLGPGSDGSNRALLANPLYASLVAIIEADLAELKAGDPNLAPGLRTVHRLFDARWLRSPTARFELVGVANRLDRRPFAAGACGEIRLIYRLAYRLPAGEGGRRDEAASRLPMTINLVTWARDENGGVDCARVAARLAASPEQLARSGLLGRERLKSVEFNLQSVRWPSTIRPDMAGHAEYLLRVLQPRADGHGERLEAAPLENTPDVARLQRDPALRVALLSYLRDPQNLSRIDDGTLVLPERFLGRRATSFSPRGLARLANRPFRQLFSPAEFAGLGPAMAQARYVKSEAALIRRLDGLSCPGCHQSRSVAGFHLVGSDRPEYKGNNAVATAASPHLLFDLPRRTRYLHAINNAQVPVDARPLSERADDGEGGYGSHCGLGDPGFSAWGCKPGLKCVASDEPAEAREVGLCLPAGPTVGDPCEMGVVTAKADPRKDRVVDVKRRDCDDDAVCQSNYAGFPTGMCSAACDHPGTACGGIPLLREFNDCLARRQPFERCIADNVRPHGLRPCDEAMPCRDDYICARTPAGQGVCMPPYFLFQLRVDGHP